MLQQLDAVPDALWFADEGLFFNSIHGTLNHLLLVDRLWLSRLEEKRFHFNGLGDEIEETREGLTSALRAQWEVVRAYGESDGVLGESRFINTQGKSYTLPRVAIFQHLVNHGTHHRGQISAVLTRHGYPAPAMDLGYMLYEEKDRAL